MADIADIAETEDRMVLIYGEKGPQVEMELLPNGEFLLECRLPSQITARVKKDLEKMDSDNRDSFYISCYKTCVAAFFLDFFRRSGSARDALDAAASFYKIVEMTIADFLQDKKKEKKGLN